MSLKGIYFSILGSAVLWGLILAPFYGAEWLKVSAVATLCFAISYRYAK